jgi:hypothetical protein
VRPPDVAATRATCPTDVARWGTTGAQDLTEHGVAEATLVAEGFGESKPIADNDTEEGRESNRRVELHVVETDDGAGGSSESAP